MHHERRQAVIGLELAALRESAIGVVLREMHGHVPAHHLEQVAILVVRLERLLRRGEYDEADERVHMRQRHDQSVGSRPITQLPADDCGQQQVAIQIGRRA